MFGFFGKKEKLEKLEKKYKEITNCVIDNLHAGDVGNLGFDFLNQETKNTLVNLDNYQVNHVKTNVAAAFIIACGGQGALQEGNLQLSKQMLDISANMLVEIRKRPSHDYYQLELKMMEEITDIFREYMSVIS